MPRSRPVPPTAAVEATAAEDAPATDASTEVELPEPPAVTPLTEPADGVPEVVATPEELARVVARFAAGTGPVAVDAERASGYRYGQRTYLVQLRRAGAGTALVDPVALPDLSSLSDALAGVEWVLHAASQDLPGLVEQRMRPDAVFDTELAARLLGMERVGLAAVVAEVLGLGLAKEHSAVDWSTRPLPAEWLRYAALDVEVLVELRAALGERLEAAGKSEWARQEFEAVRLAPPPAPRIDPWRRTSGLHTLRDARRVAVARELWLARDAEARRRDLSPGRVLPDSAIVAAATALPRSVGELAALRAFSGKSTRRKVDQWFAAVERALAAPDRSLPSVRGPRSDGPPPPRAWADRDPAAAARLTAARAVVQELASSHTLPVENLLQPDLLRRLCWTPPSPLTEDSVAAFLSDGGARPWQVGLVTGPLVGALVTLE
ncbi:HRDC domain-containing protein [Cellulomonas carbonis]|uniref:3'-5' exonuclease n=1 Tax=Cellulomonas carbonis T26 TaxID=947969 RepID=A0A0A0BZD5_9CELL|nr:HRDC domain-containing protein [Cellulomonas carbonis]KGM12554.1 3'-5' exonuclease [Cellulomonas carbonis T26]GGB93497.1 3'-5' exonuclease [Cellulomonas carbonis]